MVAVLEVTAELVKPVGAAQGVRVVNCAVAGVLVPEVQVAVILQSYKDPEARPVRLAVVAVCAAAKVVQVEDEFNLYSTR